jgi:hypothetical protein
LRSGIRHDRHPLFDSYRYCAGIGHSDIDALSFNQNGVWILPQLWKTKTTFSTAAWTRTERAAHRLHNASPGVKGVQGYVRTSKRLALDSGTMTPLLKRLGSVV